MHQIEKINTDLVIIGSGAAGLSAAIAAQRKVKNILIISKGRPFQSGSTFANINNHWGITFAENETERDYLENRINSISKGTNVPYLSSILVQESCSAFEMLLSWGVKFKKDKNGKISRVAPCFCTEPLAVIIKSCKQFAESCKRQIDWERVKLLPETKAEKIIVKSGKFTGINASHKNQPIKIEARAAVLATGGNASVFRHHITEPGLSGDGYKLLEDIKHKALIPFSNMNFQQKIWEDISVPKKRFRLSCLWKPEYLFRSAEGKTARLDTLGTAVLRKRMTHVPISNLQQDRIVDEIMFSLDRHGRGIEVINRQTGRCEYIILPFVQANNGGVIIGEYGETKLPGLFAAGEVTTGMHGGDRIGGMMIANCLVFGTRAGRAAADFIQ